MEKILTLTGLIEFLNLNFDILAKLDKVFVSRILNELRNSEDKEVRRKASDLMTHINKRDRR
ncbi:MAG: hypothetical protein QMD80_07165 [archaeon]|nr:hypothetical protein [archaeon]